MVEFSLKYTGASAANNELDFYDAAQAMMGFQRSLALTMHLAINGEIITQAPSLKNAKTLIRPPQAGSWEIIAYAVIGAVGAGMLSPKDSVAGHLTRSIYDYVIKSILGIDVDFDKTIRQQLESDDQRKKITESKIDSLIEKVENSVVHMHRPIAWSKTATKGLITFGKHEKKIVGVALTFDTYDHATRTVKYKRAETFEGVISSYNSNTYKGRIFIFDEERPVPFELSDDCRDNYSVMTITESLSLNAVNKGNRTGHIAMRAFRRESTTGRLKSLWVTNVVPGSKLL
jgi:hypothetical protein